MEVDNNKISLKFLSDSEVFTDQKFEYQDQDNIFNSKK